MPKFKDSLDIDANTRLVQKIILGNLYNSYQKGVREVDLGDLKEKAKFELLYFADAIYALREKSLIYTPSRGVFAITKDGIEEYNSIKSDGN